MNDSGVVTADSSCVQYVNPWAICIMQYYGKECFEQVLYIERKFQRCKINLKRSVVNVYSHVYTLKWKLH